MAEHKAINDAIELRFSVEVAAAHSIVTIYPNQGDNNGGELKPPTRVPFVIASVEFLPTRGRPGFGAVGFPRTEGYLHTEILVPAGAGNSAGLVIAGHIADAFDTYQTSGPPDLTFRPGDLDILGTQGPRGYWQANYDVPFSSDEV